MAKLKKEPDDDDKLRVAAQSRALLSNEAFTNALEQIELEFIQKWQLCSVNESELPIREGCHQMLKSVARLRAILEDYIDTGRLVTDKIDFLNQEITNRDK